MSLRRLPSITLIKGIFVGWIFQIRSIAVISLFVRRTLAALLSVSTLGVAHAAPITFQFTFDDPASTAQAVGSITFESTLLQNPGMQFFDLPDPGVLALNVTVSGAASGNGTFAITDFTGVVFDTNGGTLDLASQLVGQPTAGSPWATLDNNSGDFNLFSGSPKRGESGYGDSPSTPDGSNPTPDGLDPFTLGANGGNGEPMVLVGMSPLGGYTSPASLPFGRNAWIVLTGLLGLAALLAFRRRSLKN